MPRVDRASRVVRADPARVYAALVDPDALGQWLPPAGMTGRFERYDATPGGSYRLVLTYDEVAAGKTTPDSDVVEARFLDLEPRVRVVQAVEFESDDPAYAGTMRMTWALEPVGDGATCVEFRAEDVPPGISADDHAAGLESSLRNLADHLGDPYGAAVTTDALVPGCFPCDQQAQAPRPPREDVVHTDHWRVAHAFNSSLPGWLILLPTRHITSFTELTPAAADELGGLVRRLGTALETVTGCVKTYLMQFSEAEGFSHLHLHLVPRMPDHPEDAQGPRVFAYLGDDEAGWLPETRRDDIALSIRAALG
jgi:diadenosine tetraphosphate (Ap4A) HIT family hydrolase/uncharacterized protein YndB with AHSA1/START domain